MATSTKGLFGSSLARKYWMAASGLFLTLFLVGHLLGNLQLLDTSEHGKHAFNMYAAFMTTFPVIKILSYLTYGSILLHVVDGVVLTRQNRAARPVRYAKENGAANASWASRSMALLGILTLVFIVVHLKSFFAEMHWGDVEQYTYTDPESGVNHALKDLWTITVLAFQNIWYTLFYVFAMVALGFHLSHGVSSGFQSLGLNHPKYNKLIKVFGLSFSIVVPALFAMIPIYLYFQKPEVDATIEQSRAAVEQVAMDQEFQSQSN